MKSLVTPSPRLLRRLFVIVWIMLVLGVAGLVVYEGQRYAPAASPPTPAVTVSTSAPLPPGTRWYWERSQWQQPEQPQP